MACKVFRDQNNKISRVLDTNGQDSKLYKELVNYAKEEPNVFVDDYHVQDLASKGLIIDTSAEELALGGWDKAYVKYQIVEEPTLDSIKNDLFADSLFTQSSILDKNTVKNSFYIPNEMSKKELEELYLNGGSKAMEKVRRSFFFDNEVKREDYFNPDNYNVYHGTKDLDIDSNGVLTIKPSKNFNNKTDNISLTQLPGVAMDYAIRKKGLYIVRINNQYIKDDFQVENTEEISVKNKLVLNKGEYEVLEFINFDILEEREIKEKVQEKYQSKSLFYLYEMYYNMDTYDSVESDVAENDDSSKDIRRYYDPERGIEKQTLRELLKEYEGLDMTPSVVKYLTDYIHTKEEFLYKKPTLNDLMSLEMGYEYLGEFIYNLLGTKILTNQIGGNIGRSKSYFSKDEQLKILQEIIDDFNYERLLNNLGYNEEPVFADSLFTEPAKTEETTLLRIDSPNKQESKLDIQTYDKLLNLVHKLGFNIERMEEWKEKWEKKNGRKFDDSGILGLTDFVNKALVLNDSSDITFGEEAAHIIISSVKDTPQYKRAMEEVVNTQEYRDNYDAYMELYKDVEKVKEEVLGKILLNKIMNGSTREGLSSRLFKALSDIWMKVKEMFTGNKTAELRSFINEVYSNIQNENMGFFGEVSSEGQLYRIDEDAYKTSKKLKLYEDKLREAIKVRIKKFKIYKNKRTEKGNERELERIDKLMKLLANDQIDLGIVTYINHANEELEVAHNRFKELLDNINNKNYRELAEQLNTLRSYIAAHKPLVKGLVKDLRRLPDDIKEELIILNAAIDTIEQEFFESSSYILAEQLLPFYTTIPELGITTVSQVQDLLMKAPKDISWFSAWFRSMANSGDLILQGLDQIIKSATIKAQEEADSLIRSLYKVNRLVDKPYEWMLNGRYFISKYDMQKWNTNLEKFMTELYTKYNLPADKKERDAFFDTLQLEATSAYADSIINDYITARLKVLNATEYGVDALKRSKKQKGLATELARVNWAIDQVYNMYKVDQARWFESNTQTNPEYAKIIEERLREFFDSRMDEDQQKDEYFAYVINKVLSDATNLYGEKYSNYPKNISDPSTNRNLKMVIEDAQHWVSSNRGFSEYKAKNGESGFYYKRRLSLPSDLYLDSRFDAIQKDVNKKAYYDKVIELKKQMDSYLPEEHRDEFLIPQIRKDFLERLVKSPKTVLQEVKDGVIIREDDTEFGMDYQLTDENNNPVKMLPVFYTRNIERLEDMSTDITSVMAAFINMATRHKQMSEIESTMELALINVENRQIEIGDDVLGKGDSKFSQFFKGSKNIDRKLGGNAADALREYINMQVYGERKERQEFEFFGAKVSFSKLTDLFNTYVSLNTLAFNPYSAIANITTSSVYRRMEAAAGQFYNNKNLLWADAFYRKNITGVLNDVGKLESNNPLRLFLEYTDALDSFDKDVRGANAERSRFGRAFNTSSLFAFQHIGDHIVQSRVALAMADKFEVFNSKGEKIHLIKDALIFGENELRIEEGTKKKDGTPLTIQDLKFFGNKVKKVNQDLDGIYNDADAAAAQKYAQGRIVMLYRKYLVPGLDKRFRGISGGKIADLTLETTKEGMYITSGRFMYNLMKEVKANHWRLLSTTKEEWNNLSDADKQNIIRTTTEMAYIFAIAIIGTILTEASDDDEENGMLALAAYSANRLYTELRQYNNISEAYKILKSPAAGIRQLENLTEIFSKTFDPLGYVFSDDPFLREYKSGKNEGQTYFWVKTQKALPFVNTFDKWKNPREQLQYMK